MSVVLINESSAERVLLLQAGQFRFALPLDGVIHAYPSCIVDPAGVDDPRIAGIVPVGSRVLPVIDVGYLASGHRSELTADQAFLECASPAGPVLLWLDEIGDIALIREIVEVNVPAAGAVGLERAVISGGEVWLLRDVGAFVTADLAELCATVAAS
ncbi:MAG: hypothetical protein D6761_02280 [Candidatus Dadabacteria bacterium]|nr:MAG: hypothetical protein D6761_02280 [Candidatus Dadabacteria bacterium]